jgi:glycosyltransferase involved in cell wall biosynthesis
LVKPEDAEALAAAIEALYRSPQQRAAQAAAGQQWVEQFDAPRVAQLFLEAVNEFPVAAPSLPRPSSEPRA